MKKTGCCLMIMLLVLTACGRQQIAETSYTPMEIAEAVMDSQAEFPAGHSLTAEEEYFDVYLANYFHLESERVEDGVICYGDGAEASELAILLLKEASNAEAARTMLQQYLTNRASDFEGYAPQQVALVKNGVVAVRGKYVALLICQDIEAAQAAFAACFEDNGSSPSAVEPAQLAESMEPMEPVESMEPMEPAQLVEPVEPVVPAEISTETADDAQENNRPPEDAYDAQAVLQAWQTGDDSALSDMNRSILEAAKGVIAEEISADMSDYEKELAIHDWMTHWSSFDMNAFSHAPIDRAEADNRNPYGFLMNRSAMCHGYSATFQLFMDMLDIECLTVFGIPDGNGVEHSWNMVQLDGDWYCVDTAWDDPIGGTPGHTYFNVTSERLRAGSIHRWDESAVPEATATTYAYGRSV